MPKKSNRIRIPKKKFTKKVNVKFRAGGKEKCFTEPVKPETTEGAGLKLLHGIEYDKGRADMKKDVLKVLDEWKKDWSCKHGVGVFDVDDLKKRVEAL